MQFEGVVTAKRDYDGELTHLKVHPVRDGEARQPEARTKQDVVRDILDRNRVYYTALQGDESMTLKARLKVVESGAETYLRTDEEAIEEDFLAELPNF